MIRWLKQNRGLLWLGLFGGVAFLYFISEYLGLTYHAVWVPADDLIPFVPAFIIPYVLWYAYVPGLMLLAFLKDRKTYRLTLWGIFGGFLFCYAIFLIWPTGVSFRPSGEGDGFFLWLCRIVYDADRPVNVFPSVHCFEAVTVHALVFSGPWGRRQTALRIASLLLCAAICLSTVFVKQHSLVDLFGGCAVGIIDALALRLLTLSHQN